MRPRRGAALALLAATLISLHAAAAIGSEQEPIDPEAIDVAYIARHLEERIREVQDVSVDDSFYRISPRDGSKEEGRLRLAAIFPDLIRATWIEPEFFSGFFYIIDSEHNLFTTYSPATGEAQHFALDETLTQSVPIQITPKHLFTLPSAIDFDLEVVEVGAESDRPFAVVEAVHKESGNRYRARVDLERWLITRIESIRSDGRVEFAADATGIVVNQGLSAALLRRLPEGTVEKSFP